MAQEKSSLLMKRTRGESIAAAAVHILMAVFSIACVYPVLLTLVVSFSDEQSVIRNGYKLFPAEWSIKAYQAVFADGAVFDAYKVSIFITVAGTLLALLISAMAGYSMSVPKVRYRNVLAMFFYIPMVFSAGLVPWYLVCTNILKFKNSYHALIMPGLVSTFNLFLMRNYFKPIPESLAESAEIDGAGPLRTFLQIIIPLSKPIIATVTLFVALGYWNNWSNALWFIDNREMYPLQFFLYRIKSRLEFMARNGIVESNSMPTQTVQIATLFVTIGPIVLVYPFIQKFFIKGIMIGAVKG